LFFEDSKGFGVFSGFMLCTRWSDCIFELGGELWESPFHQLSKVQWCSGHLGHLQLFNVVYVVVFVDSRPLGLWSGPSLHFCVSSRCKGL
jgi:hypothetical protein